MLGGAGEVEQDLVTNIQICSILEQFCKHWGRESEWERKREGRRNRELAKVKRTLKLDKLEGV